MESATTVAGSFATRRDAELAVEHLVQEHGVDRRKVSILPASEQNSLGSKPSGGDLEQGASGEPELAGRIQVSVSVDGNMADRARQTFNTYGICT